MKTFLNTTYRVFDWALMSAFIIFGTLYMGTWILGNVISFAHTVYVLFNLIF